MSQRLSLRPLNGSGGVEPRDFGTVDILDFTSGAMMKFMQSNMKRMGISAILLAGCSATNSIDYGKVSLVDVSGTVTLDGQPLAAAVITFEDPSTGNFSFARTDASGQYTLQFDSEKDGVTPGRKVVRLSTTRSILGLRGEEGEETGESPSEGSAKSAERKQELVPDCYNTTSKLNVEITTESGTVDFDLKSDCSTTSAKQ
ncbi:MAG: hypothetical protein RLZZ232_321 [Planctomycetota bacterium]|jgi:hypothetical protein